MEDMNMILREMGGAENAYFTPVAVMGDIIAQDGGQVTIINPPYEAAPQRKRGWKHGLRMFGIYFAISNRRLKMRTPNDNRCEGPVGFAMKDAKRICYERQEGICPECGQHFEYKQMECHHVLPWCRFPELRLSTDNIALLCHHCHKEIHCNPYRNIQMMEAKAKELGIDLNERYDMNN